MSDKHPFKTMAIGLIQLILVIAFIAISFSISMYLGKNKAPPALRDNTDRPLVVDSVTVSPSTYQIAFTTTGTVNARANIGIVSQVNGRIVDVHEQFFAGGSFNSGDILFKIEPRDFELEVDRLKAIVAQAQTAYNIEKAESEAALADWKILNGDAPAPRLVARKPQLAEAWANLKAAKAQLENAQLGLDRTEFSLPFNGRVLSSDLELGQFITAGQSYGFVYATDSLEVTASLTDKQLHWLSSTNTPDIIISTELLGQSNQYRSFLKRGASELNSLTRFATVSFGFDLMPENLIPGLFVDIEINGPLLQNVLRIPSDAIQKGDHIWVLNEDNTISKLSQETVYSNDTHTVTTSDGKSVQIITNKLPGAVEGMKVNLRESNTTENDTEE